MTSQRCGLLSPREKTPCETPHFPTCSSPWWTGYSHISAPHDGCYLFASNRMFKERKKTLPLGLPCQHFPIQRIQMFLLLRFQAFSFFHSPVEILLFSFFRLEIIYVILFLTETLFRSIKCSHHDHVLSSACSFRHLWGM